MRCRLALTLAAMVVCQSLARGGESVRQAVISVETIPGEASAELTLLQQRLAERDRLQVEIDGLREATNTAAMILVDVEMLEVNLDKLHKLKLDAEPGVQFSAEGMLQSLGPDGAKFIAKLKDNNVAKSLANPRVMTISGRAASMVQGGKVPTPAAPGGDPIGEHQEIGTRLDLFAEAMGNNQVRLRTNFRIGELVDGQHTMTADGRRVPIINSTGCETTCTTKLGEIAVLSGGVTERVESRTVMGIGVQDRVSRIGTWIVLQADDATNVAGREVRVRAASHEAPLK